MFEWDIKTRDDGMRLTRPTYATVKSLGNGHIRKLHIFILHGKLEEYPSFFYLVFELF
jgi:hypothetical protein